MLTPLQESIRYKVATTAPRYKVPVPLGLAVNKIESGYGVNNGPSSAGARGPMQIMPDTAAEIATEHNKLYGTNWTQQQVLTDPDTNIAGGLYYLGKHLQKTGSEQQALLRYNNSNQYVNDVLAQRATEQQQLPTMQSGQQEAAMPPVQQPFAPLQLTPIGDNATDINSPGQREYLSAINASEQGQAFQEEQRQKAAQIQQGISATQRDIQLGQDQGDTIGIGPKILATLAALSGNFGPAMQLYEQERKTAIAKQWMPIATSINKLRLAGKPDEAIDLAQKSAGYFGARAPELAPVIQKITEKLQADQQSQKDIQDLAAMYKDEMKNNPNDPRQMVYAKIAAAAKSGTPLSKEILTNYISNMQLKSQYAPPTGGSEIVTAPGTTQFQQIQHQVPLAPDMIQREVMQRMASRAGMTPEQIVGILRNQPQSQNAAELRRAYTEESGRQAEMEATARVPIPPEGNEYLLNLKNPDGSNKYSRMQIAQGQVSAQDHHDSVLWANWKSTMAQTGGLAARGMVSTTNLMQNPVVIDRATAQPVRGGVTTNQADAQPDKYMVVEATNVPRIQQYGQLRNRLTALTQIVNELPDMNAPLSRAASYLDRRLNAVIGFNPDTTAQQALQSIAHGAIEEYYNSKGISTERFRRLTSQLTSDNVNKQGALAQLHEIITQINQDFDSFQGGGNRQQLIPTAPAQQQGKRPTTGWQEVR